MAEGEPVYLTAQSCYVVLENEAGKWLFVHRAHTGYKDGMWGLPGGHVQPGEKINFAAARELREEVGIVVDPTDLVLSYIMQRNKRHEGIEDRLDLIFVAKLWHGTPQNVEPNHHSEIGWHNPDALPDNVIDFMAEACKGIVRGERFGTFGWSEPS